MNTVQTNLKTVQDHIREYEQRYHRSLHSVHLVAATKQQPIEKIIAAIAAGQHAFGENYLQEALIKISALSAYALEWHFIGPIQRNKTRKIAEHFHWVHSIDSPLIADRLNEQRPPYLPPLNVCIEVNASDETTKSGIAPHQVETLALYCKHLPHLKLRGLMTLPAIQRTLTEQRAEFQKLRKIYDNLIEKGIFLDTLSMGMSDDMEAAIAEGATIVRIGTAIFGPRN
jgi:PLP dependent protein